MSGNSGNYGNFLNDQQQLPTQNYNSTNQQQISSVQAQPDISTIQKSQTFSNNAIPTNANNQVQQQQNFNMQPSNPLRYKNEI